MDGDRLDHTKTEFMCCLTIKLTLTWVEVHCGGVPPTFHPPRQHKTRLANNTWCAHLYGYKTGFNCCHSLRVYFVVTDRRHVHS